MSDDVTPREIVPAANVSPIPDVEGAGAAAHSLMDKLIAEFGDAAPNSNHTQLDNIYAANQNRITTADLLKAMTLAATATRRRKANNNMSYYFKALRGKIVDQLKSQGITRKEAVKSKRNTAAVDIAASEQSTQLLETITTREEETEDQSITYPTPPPYIATAWQYTCQELASAMNSMAKKWLEGTQLLTLDGDRAVIGAVISGAHDTYAKRYTAELASTMTKFLGHEIRIEFTGSWRTT